MVLVLLQILLVQTRIGRMGKAFRCKLVTTVDPGRRNARLERQSWFRAFSAWLDGTVKRKYNCDSRRSTCDDQIYVFQSCWNSVLHQILFSQRSKTEWSAVWVSVVVAMLAKFMFAKTVRCLRTSSSGITGGVLEINFKAMCTRAIFDRLFYKKHYTAYEIIEVPEYIKGLIIWFAMERW